VATHSSVIVVNRIFLSPWHPIFPQEKLSREEKASKLNQLKLQNQWRTIMRKSECVLVHCEVIAQGAGQEACTAQGEAECRI